MLQIPPSRRLFGDVDAENRLFFGQTAQAAEVRII